MFIEGDVLKVRPEWLSEDEKKDQRYYDCKYYVRDSWDNKVEVVCKDDHFLGFSIYTWPEYTMYKVGHIDPVEINNYLKK